MKTLLLTLLVLVCAVSAHAAPFLVCDPQENVDEYVVTIDGVETVVPYATAGFDDGEFAVLMDLEGIADGDHAVTVKAQNVWGESSTVPFAFLRILPGEPGGIDLHK
jgi:hypothetical protein